MDTDPIKVMLVDDDASILKHLSQLLSGDGRFKLVSKVRNSYEAVAYAVQSAPHVIVMDRDGHRDGIQTGRAVRHP